MKNGAEKSETAYRELSSTIRLSFYLSGIRETAELWQFLEAGSMWQEANSMWVHVLYSVHAYRSCTVAILKPLH